MSDNMIKLIATLNIKDSVPIINEQIIKLQTKIKPIKIDIKLDNSIKQLQSQLEALSKTPQSNALKTIQEQTRSLGSQAQKTKKEVEGLKKELSSGSKALSIGSNGIPKYLDLTGTTEQRKNDAKTLLNKSLGDTGSQVSRINIANENTKGVLKDFQVQVEKENGSLEILYYRLTKAGGAYEYLGKKIREASNATNFRKVPIDVQVDIQKEKLDAFIARLNKSGASAQKLGIDIEDLKNKLNNVGTDANQMSKFLNSFNVAENKLNSFNAQLQNQKATQRFNSGLQTAQNKLVSFEQTYKRAINSTKTMKTLSGDTTTFSAAFDEMKNRVVKSDVELNRLNADMRNFEQQASNTGLKGASAFEKFSKSFKLISTYISANQIISLITRQIREAVDELKNVDNILTEISKTSDITSSRLKQLGADSFDTASKYGRKASDYLLGVQEFSRAGYAEEQAKAMAELSLKAQAAGDMSAEMANEYIIATGAAYELTENEKALNDVLDRQNYITNRNPVNMEKIASATKLVASQAHSAGVGIDEMTAALGTMSSVTQQSGEVAARAFKGILMNLQQVKADADEIGDGGEAITSESLTKYEKATNALGVSLKEVKNGTLQLRKPMEILRDLSIAVSKESDNSIKVANLVSAVGGKYRGNQLLALLKNYEMYDKMLAEYNSTDAVNSAMEEAQKSADNWAGSMNKLQNSWTELVNQIVNSDEAIEVINLLNNQLQSITDNAVIQGVNALTKSVFEFGKNVSSLKNQVANNPIGEKISDWLLPSGLDLTGSFNAFKYIGNISKYIKGKSEDKRKEIEELEQLRKSYLSSLEPNEEITSINNIVSSYVNLTSNIKDAETAKKNLLNLQDQMSDKYDKEKTGIDLVNKSLEENIRLLSEQSKRENENFLKDNQSVIEDAKETFGISNFGENATIGHKAGFLSSYSDNFDDDKEITEARIYSQTILDYLRKNYNSVLNNIDTMGDRGFYVKSDISIDKQVEAVNALVEAYEKAYEERKNITTELDMESILEGMHEWQKTINDSYNIIEDAQKRIDNEDIWSIFEKSDEYDRFAKLINDAIELNTQLNDSTIDIADRYKSGLELSNVMSDLNNIADKYPVVSDIIESSLSGIGLAFNNTTENIISAKEAWLETLEAAQKGVVSNVDKMVSAMAKITSGEAIDSKSAWEIINLDEADILSDIQIDKNGDYILDLKQIIQLKDKILQQEIDTKEASIASLEEQKRVIKENLELEERNLARLAAQNAPNSMATNTKNLQSDIDKSLVSIKSYKEALDSIAYSTKNESIYVEELKSKLGDLSDTTEIVNAKTKVLEKTISSLKDNLSQLKNEVSNLNKEADARLKAQESVIDGYIEKEQQELNILEKESDELNKQLDTLEKQKSQTEEIIENYKTVANVVSSTIDKQIKSIEQERQSIEDFYNNQIESLKSANEEREDALEYEKKLANLANAQKNKVRVYDQARGWIYESDKEALKNAQNDLASYENSQKIKNLEKERDKATEGYSERIDSLKEYSKFWEDFVSEITDEQNELLADEILGSDWREKISKKDLDVLSKFKNGYTRYNNQLKNIVDTEIANLKKSIEAKDKDVAAKKEQIQAWQDYKSTIQDTANSIKDGLEEYNKYLDTVQLNEKATNEQRLANLNKFASRYREIIDTVADKNSEIENIEATINHLSETAAKMNGFSTSTSALGGISGIASMADVGSIIEEVLGAMSKIFGSIFHFAKGGAADYTGLAWVDGTTTSSETVFTAAQSKKLLSLVDALPNLNFKLFNNNAFRNGTTNNSNGNISIGNMTVVANNPQQFAEQFNREINRYWQTKLTENKVY